MTTKPEERHAQLELCIPYVFGRLNPGNRKQFESHLTTGCEQCARELAGLYEATALMPLLLRQEAPPSGLKQRITSRIASRKPEPSRAERSPVQREAAVTPSTRPERSWYPLVATVVGILMIVSLAFFVYQLVGTTTSQEKQIAGLQAMLVQKDEALGIVGAQQLEMMTLAGTEQGSNLSGRILWDASSRNAVINVSGLTASPEGKVYQLWILKEKKYFPVAQILPDGAQSSILKTFSLPVGEKKQVEEFLLTLESKDGATEPSTSVFLKSVK